MGILSLSRLCVSVNNKLCVDTEYFGGRWGYVMGKEEVDNLGIIFRAL